MPTATPAYGWVDHGWILPPAQGARGATLFSYSGRPVPSVLSMAKIVRKILVSFVSYDCH